MTGYLFDGPSLLAELGIPLAFVVLVGLFTGLVMYLRQAPGGDGSSIERPAEIRIDKINIQGGIGAGILVLMLLAAALIGIPELRWLAFPGIFAGLLIGGSLAFWRHRHQ